ncbi:B3 domain-containing protein [Cardamine amara subsp. amara]|uniref:B3 domain-containing protein n=1 Tax=Cardamine amara subsp. amara TaxID=228776 RepID=A0ABD1AI77_CARAN
MNYRLSINKKTSLSHSCLSACTRTLISKTSKSLSQLVNNILGGQSRKVHLSIVKQIHLLFSCGVKAYFARVHMPKENTMVTIHHHGTTKRLWDVFYRCEKVDPVFSVGWAHLATECSFDLGDTLKFMLTEPNELVLEIVPKP